MNLSSIPIGPLHLPVFGIFAAIGLIAAMLLSQRTARTVGLTPEGVWDTGLFAFIAAFVISRILLVAMHPANFLASPLMVLALPSLTYTGVWITCLLTFVYLRWKRFPVLPMLDAAAPCGMVVWFALSLGHFVEGTDAGMPTRLPWGMVTPEDTVLGRVHPVQLYMAAVALLLMVALLWLLPRRSNAGDAAAFALLAGGVLDFLLGLLRQPEQTYGESLLDPGQIAALLLVLCGGILRAMPRPAVLQPAFGVSHAE